MKKITQYIPLRMSVLLVLGILFGYHISIPTKILFPTVLVCVVLLIVSYFITKPYSSFRGFYQYLTMVLVLLVGIVRITSEDSSQQKRHYSHFSTQQNKLVFRVEKILKPTTYHTKYYAQIIRIDSIKCKGNILLNIAKDSLSNNLKIGSYYQCKSNLQLINKPLNPYTFDYNSYLKKQGIHHQISIARGNVLALDIENHNLKIIAARLRVKIQESLKKYTFDKDALGIINALVLGQRQSISKHLINSYASAGAIHILAVSGLHVGILFLILSFLLKPLEKVTYGAYLKTILIVLFLWGFALVTGLSGSVVRAVSMFTFIAIGLTFNDRKSATLHALITSFFFLVLIHPLFIFDVGFQMSYSAVLGIILFFPKLNTLLPRSKFLVPRKIWELFCVSLSATIGTLPISLYYFHQFPGLFFISNIVVVPFLGIIMGFGILVVILSLSNNLPELVVHIYNSILSLMNIFIEWIASHEQFLIKDIPFSLLSLIGTYFVIATGFRWLNKRKISELQNFLFAILMLQSIFIYEKHQADNKNELVIFHKTKESLICIKNNDALHLFHSLDSTDIEKNHFLRNYKIGTRLKHFEFQAKVPNVLFYKKNKILVVDSLGIYRDISSKPNTILLRQSPKINLSRLIELHNPKIIVADGSNYKSYVQLWRKTCREQNIAFHYTGISGAYSQE